MHMCIAVHVYSLNRIFQGVILTHFPDIPCFLKSGYGLTNISCLCVRIHVNYR